MYLKWIHKKPYIISEHWTGYHQPQSNNIGFLQKSISKVITKQASYVCPVSNDLSKSIQQLGCNGNFIRVPNVVDTKLFNPINKTGLNFTITHISNMNNDHKNIHGILNVISKICKKEENIKFQLIGEDSTKYKNYAEKLGVKKNDLLFFDHLPHKEVAQKLKESNLFILFSNYENLPCVILESFSCGVPVISTNTGGISEYFPNNFGKLINVNDENQLEIEILNYYNKKSNIVSKSIMHSYTNTNFSKKSIAENFSELYFKSIKK